MCSGEEKRVFENYPAWVVFLANMLSAIIYILGAAIMVQIGIWAMLLYLVFCFYLEFNLMSKSCVHCYYQGKLCFSGRGKISSWIFKSGDPKKFIEKEVSWLTILPDMLIVFIPVAIGVFLIFWEFEWSMPVLVIGLLIAAFPGNGYIRGTLACCYCQQCELGCPAEKLFKKS